MRLLLALLVFAFPLHATLTSSAITGRVIAGDAPAAGVTVTVSSSALQHPRTTVTGPRGTYFLNALPPGTYDVTFSQAGMTTLTRRAIVELGRVARADARLEPSEDEESVTSTATQTSVADTTAITSHFDDATLDRLPGRDYAVIIAPDSFFPTVTEIDGTRPFIAGVALPEDQIEQVTVVRAAAPVEWESYGGRLLAMRTRSGAEQFFLSLRDTVSNGAWNDDAPGPLATDDGLQNLLEAHGGGRIVPQRLWFFAALWDGDDATRYTRGQRGGQVKLNAQPGAAHHLDAIYLTGENGSGQVLRADTWTASLRYTGAFGPRYTTETMVTRHSSALSFQPQPGFPPTPVSRERADTLSSRASYVLGDHLLTAGLSAVSSRSFDGHSFYASDRWSAARWVVNAGLRYDDAPFSDGDFQPRIAATYDLRGDGTRAISASWGEYAFGYSSAAPIHIATLGYAMAIGNSGSARIDYLRRGASFASGESSLQLDTRYRLFDRFEAGATYTYARNGDSSQHANAWIGAQLPVGAHEFGVTLLQRYYDAGTVAPT
ncbi:MAG TPA: TonB-dependent receptor, partial [Thermoanaerobaculia bacterium]